MQNATDIALSRLVAQQRAMDVTANNIANADTPGFKTEHVLFSDWLSRQDGTTIAQGDRPLAYTQDRATYRDQSAGALSRTGNPLDVAIAGDGFFQVQTDAGVRLTRAGRFTLTADGTITDLVGHPLLDTGGKPLVVAAGDADISIAGDGTVATRNGTLGKIGLVQPNDPNQLMAEGGRLFAIASGGAAPVAVTRLAQGAVEDSNVQPVLEMTQMMNQLRQFQYVSEFVQSESDRANNAIDKITKRS